MFGLGGSEILVILIVALVFLGPDKLPEAAKQLSKGLRDLRKHTRQIQESIENDTQVGGAIRDLKSALRGDELRAPFEEMRRQVNAAVQDATSTATATATTTTNATAAATAAAASPAEPPTEFAAPPRDDATMPMFRTPADTLAKGAPIAPVSSVAPVAEDAAAEEAAAPSADANDNDSAHDKTP